MFVRPIRISNLVVDKSDKDIIVTFTLLDAPPTTGPVQYPLQEASLDTLIDRLRSIIDSHGFIIRGQNGTKYVSLRARRQSLNVEYESKINTIQPGSLAGYWAGFIILGLVIGSGSAFLVCKVLTSK